MHKTQQRTDSHVKVEVCESLIKFSKDKAGSDIFFLQLRVQYIFTFPSSLYQLIFVTFLTIHHQLRLLTIEGRRSSLREAEIFFLLDG